MATHDRNERIALLVIEDQIWNYRNSITNRLMTVHPDMFKDIDSDDIYGNHNRAAEIFKDITDTDIYDALGEAYGYKGSTIRTKLNNHRRRINSWVAYFTDTEIMINSYQLREIAYIFQMTEDHNTKAYKKMLKGIKNDEIDVDILTEEDIYAIKDIINKRSDTIYDGNPDSKVAPALTEFERYMLKHESSDVKVEKVESEDDVSEEDPKITDGNVIKNALKNVVETYTAMGCNSIQFEVSLDDGSTWIIDFRKLWLRPTE